MVNLEAEHVRLAIDTGNGGRLASLQIGELEILVTEAHDILHWGCYPMAPWASRIRNGLFAFEGDVIQLPKRMPPHAIHGTVLDRPWQVVSCSAADCVLETEMGSDWPWPGYARQVFALSSQGLTCRIEIHSAETPFPVSLGWHPWFRRQLERGHALDLDFVAGFEFMTDPEGMPTGETGPPGTGPVDACFGEVQRDPVLRWPGALELTLASNLNYWVVYSEPEHAVCVEPVSAPPNAHENSVPGIAPEIARPGQPVTGEFTFRWTTP